MSTTRLAAAAVATALVATVALGGVARAGEGNGDPFPTPDVGVRHVIQSPKYTMGGSAPYNYFYAGNTSSTDGVVSNGVPFGNAGRTFRTTPAAARPVSPAVAATPGPDRHG